MPRIAGGIVAAICLAMLMLTSAVGGLHDRPRIVRNDIRLVVQVAASGLSGRILAAKAGKINFA